MSELYINIGIDCAPGAIRPDAYIEGALKICGIKYNKQEPVSKLFGAWRWILNSIDSGVDTDKAEQQLKNYFDDLYKNRKIRGAEWKIERIPDNCIQIRGFIQIKMFVSDLSELEVKYSKTLENFERERELFDVLTFDEDKVFLPLDLIKSLSSYLGNDEQEIINLVNKYI